VKPFGLPTIRYAASATGPHSGQAVAILYGLPSDSLGFDVDVTFLAAGPVSASTWTLTVTRGGNKNGVWSGVAYTFTVAVPTLTAASQPTTVRAECTTSDVSLRTACVDGTTKPVFAPCSRSFLPFPRRKERTARVPQGFVHVPVGCGTRRSWAL